MLKHKIQANFKDSFDNCVKLTNFIITKLNFTIEEVYDNFTEITFNVTETDDKGLYLSFNNGYIELSTFGYDFTIDEFYSTFKIINDYIEKECLNDCKIGVI